MAVSGVFAGVPEKCSQIARCFHFQDSGHRNGKSAAHHGSTLPQTLFKPSGRAVCVCVCVFQIDSYNLLEVSDSRTQASVHASEHKDLLASLDIMKTLERTLLNPHRGLRKSGPFERSRFSGKSHRANLQLWPRLLPT